MPNQVKVIYHTNYNGLTINGDCINTTQLDECEDKIIDDLYELCDEDGEFVGSEKRAIDIITNHIKDVVGDVEVVVEFDNFSS